MKCGAMIARHFHERVQHATCLLIAEFWRRLSCLFFLTLLPPRAAEDAYFDLPFDRLTLTTEGKIPKPNENMDWRYWQIRDMLRPYVVLDGPGEAYCHRVFSGPPAVGGA